MDTRHIWRHQYDDVTDEIARANTRIRFEDPSLTQQHFARDADLNTIIKRYGITDGAIPPAALDPKYFGDFTDEADFRDHLERIRNAENRFNALPANIRSMFDNDMIFMHDWVTAPENVEEAVKLGLLQKQSVTPPPTPTRNGETGKEELPSSAARQV